MGAQHVLFGLLYFPVISVPDGAVSTRLVCGLYPLQVVIRELSAVGRISEEESVVSIASRMLLGLKESVEVPEGALHVSPCGHFLESHFEENLSVLLPHLEKGMEVAAVRLGSEGIEVVGLEGSILVRVVGQQTLGKIRFGLLSLQAEGGSLLHSEYLHLVEGNKLSLLQSLSILARYNILASSALDIDQLLLYCVFNRVTCLLYQLPSSFVAHYPLLLHGCTEANLAHLAELGHQVLLGHALLWHCVVYDGLRGSFFSVFVAFSSE
mmetsp:Transcript_23146/g.58686  ORF Transcript_23146/g.58686 Transcript_23146/m.58686 type:complete len:267 (-) Transcript_23146:189-989(-)